MDLPLKSGLYKKLAIYSVLIALALGIVLSLFQIYADYKQQGKKFDQEINNIIQLVKPSAEKAVFEFDEKLGKLVLDSLFDQENILRASIIDDYGDVFQSATKDIDTPTYSWISNLPSFQSKELRFPLKIQPNNPKSQAAILIFVDPYISTGNFFERFWLIILTGLIRSILIALVLLFVSYRIVTKPIQSLAKELSDIDPFSKELQKINVPENHKENELGLLVNKINGLFNNLGNGIKRIQNLNNKLNDEIKEREQIEELINYAETNTRGITGYDYINTMLRFLTDALQLRAAVVAKKLDTGHFEISAHYFSDLRILDPQSLYDQEISLNDSNFELDHLLINQELKTPFFKGNPTLLLPVKDHEGFLLGFIGLIKVSSFNSNFFIQHKALLQIFTSRISTEFIRDSQIKVIENLAHNDSLTQLSNRHHFHSRLQQLLREAKTKNSNLSLIYLDLYRFKWVNDSFGHKVGDRLLIQVADRLKAVVSHNDLVARIGGDEFAILLIDQSEQQAQSIATKVHKTIDKPFSIDGITLNTKVSIGITSYATNTHDANDLLKNADMAMFLAKSLPEPKTQVYSETVNQQVARRLALETAMHQAINDESFYLVFQPQYHLEQNRIIGAEALIRWEHPELGFISPDEFIPIAEETGMIHQISNIVIKKSAIHARKWLTETQYQFKISVNVSAYQLKSTAVFDDLISSIKEEIDIANYLTIEITETALIENIEVTASLLEELTKLGINISIDDFGTGYSSLGYLKSLPLHTLKIDKAFISAIPESANDIHIVQAVIALSKAMKLEVVAEGVETQAQVNLLKDYGCDYVQGYFYSKPVSADALSQLIHEQQNQTSIRSVQ